MNLLQIIEDVLKAEPEEKPRTEVGMKLLDAVVAYRRQAEKREITPAELSEIEQKILLLKAAEGRGDLAWMDMRSWYSGGVLFRRTFANLVQPLIYDGVYFEHSVFVQTGKPSLFDLERDVCFQVISDWGSLRFIAVKSDRCCYDGMNEYDLKRAQRRISSRCVFVYGSAREVRCG